MRVDRFGGVQGAVTEYQVSCFRGFEAVSMVSASRISPIMMTSASRRSTRRIASANPPVSTPTSRRLTIDSLSPWSTSMGILDGDDVAAWVALM